VVPGTVRTWSCIHCIIVYTESIRCIYVVYTLGIRQRAGRRVMVLVVLVVIGGLGVTVERWDSQYCQAGGGGGLLTLTSKW